MPVVVFFLGTFHELVRVGPERLIVMVFHDGVQTGTRNVKRIDMSEVNNNPLGSARASLRPFLCLLIAGVFCLLHPIFVEAAEQKKTESPKPLPSAAPAAPNPIPPATVKKDSDIV